MSTFISDPALHYSDVLIVPQFSTISTRKEVDTSVSFLGWAFQVPIIAANMDTICGPEACIALWQAGALGFMHRFQTIDQNVLDYKQVLAAGCDCVISVGVNPESLERYEALFLAGARRFCIDIAHGHSALLKAAMTEMKKRHHGIFIVAGNVGTWEAVRDLELWGADAIKTGLSLGSACQTKNVTGVSTPMFSCVKECAQVATVPLIADGGIKEYGDACKAIAIGATMVMAGGMFAGCSETPPRVAFNDASSKLSEIENRIGKEYASNSQDQKNELMALQRVARLAYDLAMKGLVYRGSASQGVMDKIGRTGVTPEGKSISATEDKGCLKDIIAGFKGGLQSACSYSNATSLKQFKEKAVFRIKG
jgi:GMP reductase